MTERSSCVPHDRLTALALLVDAPETDHDQQQLAHVAHCSACAARLAELRRDLNRLQMAAWQEADALFDDAALDTQRAKILDRLAHLGKVARVLRFPRQGRTAAMPVSPISRRWVSVAAAAGLLIGLLTGQLIHFVPSEGRQPRTATLQGPPPARATNTPMILQTSATFRGDEELLDEIDDAMELSRAATLRALDAFTPRVGDLVEIR
jgi:hypothetical protein